MATGPGHQPGGRAGQVPNLVALLHGLQFCTTLLNLAWAVYMLATPATVLATNATWRDALAVLPGHSPAVLGMGFLAVGLLNGVRAMVHQGMETIGWLAHGLGISLWLFIAGSWAYGALTIGVGWGNVATAAFLAVIHAGLLWTRRV